MIEYNWEFNSLNDWGRIVGQLTRQIHDLQNYKNQRDLNKMLSNLQDAARQLSMAEVQQRRTHNSNDYLAKLATVREQLANLLHHITFATLVDTKSER